MKIRDRVTLGVIAGIIGGYAGNLIDYLCYKTGLSSTYWPQEAIGLTVSRKQHDHRGAGAIGLATTTTICAILGVAQTYFYSATGKDNKLLKGVGVGFVSWLAIHGLGNRVTYTFNSKYSPPKTSAVSLLSNIVHALVSSEIISKFGDEKMFPENPKLKVAYAIPGGKTMATGETQIRQVQVNTVDRG